MTTEHSDPKFEAAPAARIGYLLLVAVLTSAMPGGLISARGASPSFASVELPPNPIMAGLIDRDGNRIVSYESWGSENGIIKSAASGETLWVNSSFPLRGSGAWSILNIAADKAGNIYVLGELPESDPQYFDQLGIRTEGTGSSYLAKLASTTGSFEWARLFGSAKPPANGLGTRALAVDDSGSYYIGGSYNAEAIRFGNVVLPAPAEGTENLYVGKFAADGQAIWIRVAQGSAQYPSIGQIAVDKAQNVIVTGGSYESVYTFLDAPDLSAGSFLTKFNSEGIPLWSQRFPNPATTGKFALDPVGSIYLVAGNYPTEALLKYSPGGALLWQRSFNASTTTRTYGWAPTVGPDGSCYMAGLFGATAQANGRINPGQISFGDLTLTTKAFADMFLMKYSNAGDPQWALNSIGLEPVWAGTQPQRASIVQFTFLASLFSVGSDGRIVVSGSLNGTVQFGDTLVEGPGSLEDPLPFIATVVDASPAPSVQPPLRIVETKNSLELSWPTAPPGFLLESASALDNANWVAVSTPPTQVASENVVTVERTDHARFYRLRKP